MIGADRAARGLGLALAAGLLAAAAPASAARPPGEAPPPAEPPREVAPSTDAASLDARFASDEEGAPLDGYAAPGFGRSFVEMLVVLGAVCLLAYLLLGKVLPRVLRVPTPTASGRLLTVLDRLPIDPRRSILVVKMGDEHFLVGSAEQGLTLLARLDPGEVRDAMAAARLDARPSPWAGWTSLLRRGTGDDAR